VLATALIALTTKIRGPPSTVSILAPFAAAVAALTYKLVNRDE
jgi:hypothetical protein